MNAFQDVTFGHSVVLRFSNAFSVVGFSMFFFGWFRLQLKEI